jgi:hypothetical protein
MNKLFLVAFICLSYRVAQAQYINNSSGYQVGRIVKPAVYDKDNNQIGRIDDGRAYDRSGNEIGRFDGTRIYKNGNQIGSVDGNILYDGSRNQLARFDGDNVLLDRGGYTIFRTQGLSRADVIMFFYFFKPKQ